MTHSAPAPFPPTRYSVVAAAGARGDADAFGILAEAYWKPVYKYVRFRWRVSTAEAEDLTQGFFARAFEKEYLGSYDRSKARFRTFLRNCLDRFVANERTAGRRLKRGGEYRLLSLDLDVAEQELQRTADGPPLDFDAFFEREWIRGVFSIAVDALRANCSATGHERRFRVFECYDLEGMEAGRPPTYADVARELGISPTDVTNELAAARREFRRCVLSRLRELTRSDEEFILEVGRLLGLRSDDVAL